MDLFASKILQINVYNLLFPFQKHKDYSEAWYKFNTHERETLKVSNSSDRFCVYLLL